MGRKHKKTRSVFKSTVTKTEKLLNNLKAVKEGAANELLLQAYIKLEENTEESRNQAIDLYCGSKQFDKTPINVLSLLIADYTQYKRQAA